MLAITHNKGDVVSEILEKLKNETFADIEKQFFINAQNKDGNTALHLAFIKNYQTIAQILERDGGKIGLDYEVCNRKNQKPKDI